MWKKVLKGTKWQYGGVATFKETIDLLVHNVVENRKTELPRCFLPDVIKDFHSLTSVEEDSDLLWIP